MAALATFGLLAGCGRSAPEGEVGLGGELDPAAEGVTVGDASTSTTVVADDGQMTSSSTVAQQAQADGQTQVAAPVIITAGSLTGVVDQSPDRAGVRVTSSDPIVAAAPVVTTTTTTTPMAQGGIHVVQSGDTLSVIAETYGIPAQAIADANGLENLDSLKLGQELIIPTS